MFYSYNQIRSHNAIFNFILSNRGGGKTYGAKLIGIKDYLKNGQEFMYVRRYKTELESRSNFFDDIMANNAFPGFEFMVKGYKGYIREKEEEEEDDDWILEEEVNGKIKKPKKKKNKWRVICYFIPLTAQQRFKSTPYPNVTKIFFDEFIIDGVSLRYLKNEVEAFLSLFETVNRLRTGDKDILSAFFLGNKVSIVNPYFTYFNIPINESKRFSKTKDNNIVVEMFTDTEFIEEKEKTRFGKFIKGTNYGDYNIYNKSLQDNNHFIIKRPRENLEFILAFNIRGYMVGVWWNRKENFLFLDNKYNQSSPHIYALFLEDLTPDYKFLNSFKFNQNIKFVLRFFSQNQVFYSNQEVKNHFINTVIKYL